MVAVRGVPGMARVAALAPLLLLVALLPPGHAQVGGPGLSIEVRTPPVTAAPEVPFPVTIAITADCDALLRHQDSAAPGTASVAVTWTAPAYATVVGPAVLAFPLQECPGSLDATVEETYSITLGRQAPGLKSLRLDVAAAWTGPAANSDGDATETVVVAADYDEVTVVKVPQKLQTCDCRRLDFQVELENQGNARTQYDFELVGGPGASGWDIRLPDPIILDSPVSGAGGKTAETAIVSISMDGVSGKGAFELLIRPASADQPDKKGEPITVGLLAHRSSFVERMTPGLGGPVMLWALVALAVALRRRA